MAEQNPEHAYLRWPATAVTVFWVLCIQVVIVSTWKLLTLVKNDRIFSRRLPRVGERHRVGHRSPRGWCSWA